MKNYAFGVDVGGTTVKMGLFESSGKLLENWEIPTRKDEGGKYILGDIASAIKAKMEEDKIPMDQVEGIGLGVPGPVLEDGTVRSCVNLGWGSFNVEQELGSLCEGLPVKAGNDANVAALGEMWKGGGKGYKNVVMVTLGTGVGGGIVVGGKIIPGSFGAGGEIGHMQMDKDETAVCNCGKTGCLEQYASATGIVRKAQKELNESDTPSVLRKVQYLSAKEIFDAAKQGDQLSQDLVEFLGETLGTALAHVACVVDPQIFVIGGGVSKAGQILLDVTQKHYKEAAFSICREAKFALAKLGNDAGMYGAVKLILD